MKHFDTEIRRRRLNLSYAIIQAEQDLICTLREVYVSCPEEKKNIVVAAESCKIAIEEERADIDKLRIAAGNRRGDHGNENL